MDFTITIIFIRVAGTITMTAAPLVPALSSKSSRNRRPAKPNQKAVASGSQMKIWLPDFFSRSDMTAHEMEKISFRRHENFLSFSA
jgi:hypothetical protein